MAFPPLGNSHHVDVPVSINFPSNCHWDVMFHCIACDYSRADWDGLQDNLRDVTSGDIFKLSISAAASEFVSAFRLELEYISLIVSIGSSLTHLHGFQLFVLLP